MRVAVGGLYHESNTFAAARMTRADFADGHLHDGAALVEHWAGTASEVGGFLEGARRRDWDVVPTLMAWGMPSGIVAADAFDALTGDLVGHLRAAGPLDGVLLSLHGAMVAEHHVDADGEVLARIRAVIGPDVPLVATLDFHANLSDAMVRWPDALIGYDTYPHVDQQARGLEAADVLSRIVSDGLQVRMALARRPFLPHILCQPTGEAPMSLVVAAAHAEERQSGVVAVSVAAGFPYTDVPDAGFGVLAVAGDDGTARAAAERVADVAWAHRREFVRDLPGIEAGVRAALQPSGADGPVVLVDVGDNIGAGTPGDGTVVLAELLRQGARDSLVLLYDPEAVAACAAAGVRAAVSVAVGGKCDQQHGSPVSITGHVRVLTDGIYKNVGPMRGGLVEDQGRTALVETAGVLVVLTERRAPMWNLQQLRALGVEPARLRVIVVKGAVAHRAAYAPIARRIIEVDTPGLSVADVRTLPYQRLQRPIYPLDAL